MEDIRCVIDWPGTMNFLKDIVATAAYIATIFGVWIAYKSINKWRTEESGKADFDLARRVGKSIFQLRDALSEARRPFILPHEPMQDNEIDELSKVIRDCLLAGKKEDALSHVAELEQLRKNKEPSNMAYILDNRIRPVHEVAMEMQVLRNEVEALWGEALVKTLTELHAIYLTLRSSMQAHVIHLRDRNTPIPAPEDEEKKVTEIIFDRSTKDTKNSFTDRIDKAMDEASRYLKTKLPRPSLSNASK